MMRSFQIHHDGILRYTKKSERKSLMDFFLPCFCFKGQIAIITLQPECFGAFWGHFPDTTRKRSLKERSTTSRLHPNLGVPKLLMIMKVLTPPENSQLVHLKLNIPPKGSKQLVIDPNHPNSLGLPVSSR